MANRYAVASGNWSATATWDGGTLPTSADDVFANGFTVTIDQAVNVLSIRNTSDTGINAGGQFNLTTAYNITADIRAGSTGNSQSCLVISFNSPSACTITGNIYGTATTHQNISAIFHTGTGPITINGNIFGAVGIGSNGKHSVNNQSNANITINGDLFATTTTGVNSTCVSDFGTGTLTINGSCYGSSVSDCRAVSKTNGGSYIQTGNILGITSSSNSVSEVVRLTNVTTTINGNIESALNGVGLLISGNSTFLITGNVTSRATGNNFASALNPQNTVSGTINGNVLGSSTSTGGNNNAILNQSTGLITINGNLTRQGSGGNALWMAATNNVVINGSLSGAVGSSGGAVIRHQGFNASLIINGNVNAMPTSGDAMNFESACTTIINGDVFGGAGNAATLRMTNAALTAMVLTINGRAVAGTVQPAVNFASGTITIRRVVGNGFGVGSTGITQTFAVTASTPAQLIIQEFECGALGAMPISQYSRFSLTANSVAIFRDVSGNAVTLVNPSSVVTPPAVTDVRSGVTYNAGNLTGICAVPAASSVAAGVAVGNTVGTAVLTQANVWDYALSSASSVAGSVGEKLKKTAIPADIIALG